MLEGFTLLALERLGVRDGGMSGMKGNFTKRPRPQGSTLDFQVTQTASKAPGRAMPDALARELSRRLGSPVPKGLGAQVLAVRVSLDAVRLRIRVQRLPIIGHVLFGLGKEALRG
ncbi:hypothetical protein D7Y13_05145 [Corallococcus praedator]|uniref:DUF721 domain-containing protein n=1 Tax=Corallococcus praedator TaxID=2316724 RepID=A0ABX9QPJ3_9BACT|nr:hypothetical protein D7X75_11090 [Corallococcus sp. CA031C]RKI14906.1 hypothetical protein D7Y13_05145 [Corallococcus praedator]